MPESPELTRHKKEKDVKPKKSLLTYSALAPAAALAIIISGCNDSESQIKERFTPTSITRHLDAKTPGTEHSGIKSAGVEIQTDETVVENISPLGRSINQDSQSIIEVAQKFPLPERITVILTSSYRHDRSEPALGIIHIGRDRIRTETLKYETAHELAHILDPENNETYLLQFFTPNQVNELKKLREEILNDEIWGRDYPSIGKILNGKSGANIVPNRSDSPAKITAGSDIDANGIWIEIYNPFESDLRNSHLYLENAKTAKDRYDSLDQFIGENKELINEYFAATPLAHLAREDFYAYLNSGQFRVENTVWSAQTEGAYLDGRYEYELKAVLERITKMILFEKYENGSLEPFLENLPESKKAFLKNAFQYKRYLTDSEKFAHVIAATVSTGTDSPANAFLEKIAQYNEINSDLQPKK